MASNNDLTKWPCRRGPGCANHPTVRNFMNDTEVPTKDAVEKDGGRWYIKMGFAGFNCARNNGDGFDSSLEAVLTITTYQTRSRASS